MLHFRNFFVCFFTLCLHEAIVAPIAATIASCKQSDFTYFLTCVQTRALPIAVLCFTYTVGVRRTCGLLLLAAGAQPPFSRPVLYRRSPLIADVGAMRRGSPDRQVMQGQRSVSDAA